MFKTMNDEVGDLSIKLMTYEDLSQSTKRSLSVTSPYEPRKKLVDNILTLVN